MLLILSALAAVCQVPRHSSSPCHICGSLCALFVQGNNQHHKAHPAERLGSDRRHQTGSASKLPSIPHWPHCCGVAYRGGHDRLQRSGIDNRHRQSMSHATELLHQVALLLASHDRQVQSRRVSSFNSALACLHLILMVRGIIVSMLRLVQGVTVSL